MEFKGLLYGKDISSYSKEELIDFINLREEQYKKEIEDTEKTNKLLYDLRMAQVKNESKLAETINIYRPPPVISWLPLPYPLGYVGW